MASGNNLEELGAGFARSVCRPGQPPAFPRVLSLEEAYDPAQPEYSTLLEMNLGEGYLIRMTGPATLAYPAAAPMPTMPATIFLAKETYKLPGPTMTSTFLMVWVP